MNIKHKEGRGKQGREPVRNLGEGARFFLDCSRSGETTGVRTSGQEGREALRGWACPDETDFPGPGGVWGEMLVGEDPTGKGEKVKGWAMKNRKKTCLLADIKN